MSDIGTRALAEFLEEEGRRLLKMAERGREASPGFNYLRPGEWRAIVTQAELCARISAKLEAAEMQQRGIKDVS